MSKLKGLVFQDKHPSRKDRKFAVVWEGGRFVDVFSTSYRTSRISKKRLFARYESLNFRVDTNGDFVPELN